MVSLRDVFLAPLYAAYGAWVIVRALWHGYKSVAVLPRLFEVEIRCRTCGFKNAVHERWACGDCGAEYVGAVHTCDLCGAGANWFPCTRCRAAIPLKVP